MKIQFFAIALIPAVLCGCASPQGQANRRNTNTLNLIDQATYPEKIGQTWKNSIGMQFAFIPAGEFLMGSPVGEQGRSEDEGPQHHVQITKPFMLGVFDVTKGQLATFINDTGYKTEAENSGKAAQDNGFVAVSIAGATWKGNPVFKQNDKHPVIVVSWNDAEAFCDWLSKKEGRHYRLPTEAEWEYCCRAGTTTPYNTGESIRLDQANYNGDHETTPVGKFPPNAWGLYDMHGNVWQWCQDWYSAAYASDEATDPSGPSSGVFRVLRGGSCGSYMAWNGRSACRFKATPSSQFIDFGFRVYLDFQSTTNSPVSPNR
jgi:formylglycine-generating enzyme required for sulfatase activity